MQERKGALRNTVKDSPLAGDGKTGIIEYGRDNKENVLLASCTD